MKTRLQRGEAIWALGTMSGTSLDGVDAALLLTDGVRIKQFGPHGYHAYDDAERATLAAALGHWQGDRVKAAAAVVNAAHLDVLSDFPKAELIGFHGQTLAHDPRGRGTLQVGDGEALSRALDRPVIWDFRSADVAAGGEGAPLAPFYHHACARYIGAEAPICFLNLGGVGNLTWVDPSVDAPETPGALLAFDTGPANAPVNDLMMSRCELPFDKGGAMAAQGQVDQGIISTFLQNAYFMREAPKSLDRNDFPDLLGQVSGLSDADAAATLTAICADSVAEGMRHCPQVPSDVLVTGGGRHNPVLMSMLSAQLPCPVRPVEDVGLDGDMLEAQAFAFLAARVMRDLPISCGSTTGVRSPTIGGRLSDV